ncbi:hypothetical protein ABI59_18450 [Acidobacteria bacterium Mor1]|nr:hypothetical protein ABI59_18450 [Acidobacteria bacterium Mor1]
MYARGVSADDRKPELDALRERLREDLQPVAPMRPLAPLLLGALALAGLGAAVLASRWGLRSDRSDLGPWIFWGLTLIQAAMALPLFAGAARGALPAPALRAARISVLTASAVFIAVCAMTLTARAGTLSLPADKRLAEGFLCFGVEFALGLPIALWSGLILARGFPAAPAGAGLLAGLAAALLADACWRLICPFGEAGHVVPSHGAGMLLLVALTTAGAVLWGVRRRSRIG